MAKDQEPTQRGRGFKRLCQFVFLGSLLGMLARAGCSTRDYIDYVTSLSAHGQQQKLVERSFEDESLLEQQLKTPDHVEQDTSPSLADFLKEGQSPHDLGNYLDPHQIDPDSGKGLRQMDATSLLLTAKEFRFKLDPPQQDQGINPAEKGGPEKYLNPHKQTEKGHQFELRKAEGSNTLVFSRETSYIVPRGQLDYGSRTQERRPETQLEIIKSNQAVVMVDTSGSMCSNPHNFRRKTFHGQTYEIYLPSAFALSIADFYVHDQHTCAYGYTFSTDSQATPCTQNMSTLANHYAQVQCGATYINYQLLGQILKGANSALDIYIIADNDIFSENDMRDVIRELQQVMGTSNNLNRVFFIEWRTEQQGYNPRKDQIIKQTGIPNTFYSKITKPEDMEAVVRTLNEKLRRSL